MNDAVGYIQSKLAHDRGSPNAEWELVEELLNQFSTDREAITQWLFEHYNGYVDTRTRAGVEFVELHPAEGWVILDRLICSGDPDDRDTALAVLEVQNHQGAARLALPLLDDERTYIKLEAAAFIARFYPSEANKCLRELLHHESSSARERAQVLLAEMGMGE